MSLSKGKGKETAISKANVSYQLTCIHTTPIDLVSDHSDLDSDSDSSASSSSSDNDSSDYESDVTPEYLESLLEKARSNASAPNRDVVKGEDIITLDDEASQPYVERRVLRHSTSHMSSNRLLPPLDPGNLPVAYFQLGESRRDGPLSFRDPDVELAEKASSSRVAPEPPIPPPELTKSGKPLTKKEKKKVCGHWPSIMFARKFTHMSTAQEQNRWPRLV